MAIASPSAPTFFCCSNRNGSSSSSFIQFLRFPPLRFIHTHSSAAASRNCPLTLSSRLNASSSSSCPSNGYDFEEDRNDNTMTPYELQHGDLTSSPKRRAAAGVEGVVMEVWWGLVEKDSPRDYDWRGYFEILTLAKSCKLKVRAVMAFHQCGRGPDNNFWIPLPEWVLEEMEKDQELACADRLGRRNKEYISLGCDNLPVLRGRSPIQAYADFMRNFKITFEQYLGGVITV